jgi:predicted transcriptional regulator of viral defense system
MGKQKYTDRIGDIFKKSPVVTFSDVDRIVRDKRKTDYAKQLIHHLVRMGKVKRLTKGCYTTGNDIGLSVLCFRPAYLGLQSAVSFHALWEQETIPVIITSAHVRPGIRTCMGGNILVRRSRHIFGYEYYEDSGQYLPYSDIEKTFLDFFVFREKLSPEVMRAFRERIDSVKLKRYPKIRNTVMDAYLGK